MADLEMRLSFLAGARRSGKEKGGKTHLELWVSGMACRLCRQREVLLLSLTPTTLSLRVLGGGEGE